jgi:hypothetical protein
VKDINGEELRTGAPALLLCEILSIEQHQVIVRIMNSDTELAVGTKYDEVLGGLVADSELTAFHDEDTLSCVSHHPNDDQADGVKTCRME